MSPSGASAGTVIATTPLVAVAATGVGGALNVAGKLVAFKVTASLKPDCRSTLIGICTWLPRTAEIASVLAGEMASGQVSAARSDTKISRATRASDGQTPLFSSIQLAQ